MATYPDGKACKRAIDVSVAAIGLALLALPFALIAIAIKLDSPGPIFFRQVRVGRFGRPFRIVKFRSMTDKGALNTGITTSDEHVTGVGRFLRASKLDELPQLINVLHGDMSLVGPRPEQPAYVAKYSARDKQIVLSVRPGLTDFASIVYRRENELLARQPDPLAYYEHVVMPAKLAYCRFYVRRASLALDLYLIARTLAALGADALGLHPASHSRRRSRPASSTTTGMGRRR